MAGTRSTTDRPGSRRRRVALATTLLAMVAWIVLFWHLASGTGRTHAGHALGQHGSTSLLQPGVPEAIALDGGLVGVALYLLMWGTMMVAMMFPSAALRFQRYADSLRGRPPRRRLAGIAAFVGTYAVVWTVTGVVPLAVNAVVPVAAVASSGWGLLGLALVLVGGYQVSPQKRACLRHCRAPSAVIGDLDGESARPAVQGWRFGLFDVGSCGPLMGLLVVLGSMNLFWMVLVTVAVTIERLAPSGERFARLLGVITGGAGVVLVAATVA